MRHTEKCLDYLTDQRVEMKQSLSDITAWFYMQYYKITAVQIQNRVNNKTLANL